MKLSCTNCGANISFEPKTQKVYCQYCGSQIDISKVRKKEIEKKLEADINRVINLNKHNTKNENNNNLICDEYMCCTCGAMLLADETLIITECIYCGSRQIIKEKMQGRFEPQGIIPFKIDKDKALLIYKNFIGKKFYAPKEFRCQQKIKDIKGVYIPFYLFLYDVDTYARGEAVYSADEKYKYKYFETQFNMKALPTVDTSNKYKDNIISALEPFDFKEITEFESIYLSGFFAERGNESEKNLETKAENRCITEVERILKRKLQPFKLKNGKVQMNFRKQEKKFILLPVWFINASCNDKTYSFILNGQTGKIIGDVPVNQVISDVLTKVVFIAVLVLPIIMLLIIFLPNSREIFLSVVMIIMLLIGLSAPLISIFSDKRHIYTWDIPIKILDVKTTKEKIYSRKNYINLFGVDELMQKEQQVYRNGVNRNK